MNKNRFPAFLFINKRLKAQSNEKYFASSELIINEDGSVFHLHVKPEWLADKVILVGDPGRVALVASHFENKECEVESREFKTITGTYQGKRITVVSTGIGCDNIDIVMNELDALANIDFETREEKPRLRSLELVRIGTCGGLQPYTPVGTFVCSENPSVSTVCSTSMPDATPCATYPWSVPSSTIWDGPATCVPLPPTSLTQALN